MDIWFYFCCILRDETACSYGKSLLIKNTTTLFQMFAPFCMSTIRIIWVPLFFIFAKTCYCWVLFLIILEGVYWYLVLLIFISLMTNNIEKSFMYLSVPCISSSVKCLFKYSGHFFPLIFCFHLYIFLIWYAGNIFYMFCIWLYIWFWWWTYFTNIWLQ